MSEIAEKGKSWPVVGQELVHHYRTSREGTKKDAVVAHVIEVNKKKGVVKLRVGDNTYQSLSAAALAQTGQPTNGWVFWGLKKPRQREVS